MLEVRSHRRPNLDEVRLDVRALDVGNELLVEAIEEGLMLADLRVDVVLVEVGIGLRPERSGRALGIAL